MIKLTHRVTGHQIKTDEASVEFWKAAGYLAGESESKPAPRRRATKKAAEKSSDEK